MKNENNEQSFVKRISLIPRLVCLLMAFMIWIYVMEVDSPDYEAEFEDVPITLVGTSVIETNNDLAVFSGADTTVDVTVKGQKSVISRYTKDDIIVNADVSGVTEGGRSSFDLFFDLPSGLSLVSKSAYSVDLFIDKRVVGEFDISAKLSSYKVATDYELGQISCEPSIVSVTGPSSVISDISYASVDVNMGDNYVSESMVTDGNIVLMNSKDEPVESRYLKLSQNSVKVSVPVFAYKDISLKAAYKYGYFENDNTKVTIDPETVRVKGDPSKLKSLDSLVITTLDEKSITDDKRLLVDIITPDGITLADGEPDVAIVDINRSGMTKRALSVKNITVDHDKNMNCEVLTKSVSITIIADSDIVADISADDITLYADMRDMSAATGTMLIPVEVRIDYNKGTVYELGDYNIQVSVSK